jgi:integrase
MSASVSKDAKGLRLDIRIPGRNPTCIRGKRLGIGNNQAAFTHVAFHVNNLIGALQVGGCVPSETQGWLARAGDALYAKLHKIGLVPARNVDRLLLPYLREFVDDHGKQLVKSSRQVLGRALAHAERFFAEDETLGSTDLQRALQFRRWLQGQKGQRPGTLMAEATVNKTCRVLSQAFDHAVELAITKENPFGSRKIPKSVGGNPDHYEYVSRDRVFKVMSLCRNQEDRILIALGRFACLRIPSEIRHLRWQDIDWEKREMTIRSPKTARHGKGSRKVPIFPDLYSELRMAYESGASSEYVLPTLRKHSNLNQRVKRMVKLAGDHWKKTNQNLRASGVEDWIRASHPVQDVARWCGHTVKVMFEHYTRITNAHSASDAALKAAREAGQGAESCPSEVVVPVVTSAILRSGKQESPDADAPEDFGFSESADDECELVTVGGDSGDHLSMDLIGPERSSEEPVISVRLGSAAPEVVVVRQSRGSIDHAHAPLIDLLRQLSPEGLEALLVLAKALKGTPVPAK